ncbi:hypothetical protein [Dactylosporangium sp. NPDC050588]|uniref:hypothetical protein n=1 Tax=Dactylosporangium sp. NPDC050588 TaxID=3157211 RepID=UPI003404523E
MTTTGHQYRSDFAKGFYNSGRVEGMAAGKAEALLTVLATRGLMVTDEHRALIAGCTEDAQLDTWLRRAVGAEKIQELGDEFAG